MLKTASATIALLALANPAFAAGCATPSEAAALKTAVIQQELMVAALQCHETAAYNRFVMNYRGELQASDATLKSFFVRRGGEHGESGYDTFKTKAANLSALEQARNAGGFCADAHALFAAAFAHRGSLMSFVESRAGQTDIGGICAESRPVLARSEARPAISVPVTVAAGPADVAVGGVPTHSLPAIPYGHEAQAAPIREAARESVRESIREPLREPARESFSAPVRVQDSRAAVARDEDEDWSAADADEDEAPPPPRQRYADQRGYRYAPGDYRPSYGQGYSQSYGPPPGWRQDWRDYPSAPPPRYGWYSRGW